MQFRLLLTATYMLLLGAFLFIGVEAQASRPRHATNAGLITDRLSATQLKRWDAIKRLALALGANRQPLHPTLTRLWEWAETSGHAIYIELPGSEGVSSSIAGRFDIEWLDPQGKRHLAVIRLFLANIDLVDVGPGDFGADSFIPMKGLNKEERYAEVLGHELAHAYHVLTDMQRAESVQNLVNRTNDLLHSYNARGDTQELGQEMLWLLFQRDSLLIRLEVYAEDVEASVWRELIASQKKRGGKMRRSSRD
jgi:hypothetical protein